METGGAVLPEQASPASEVRGAWVIPRYGSRVTHPAGGTAMATTRTSTRTRDSDSDTCTPEPALPPLRRRAILAAAALGGGTRSGAERSTGACC